MKCIKGECRYYQDHEFYQSYFVCNLIGNSSKKDSDRDCLILDIIQDAQDNIEDLKNYAVFIENNLK
jgi:hypothetical protein